MNLNNTPTLAAFSQTAINPTLVAFLGRSTCPRCPRSTAKPPTKRIGILAHGKMSVATINASDDPHDGDLLRCRVAMLMGHTKGSMYDQVYRPPTSDSLPVPDSSTVKRAFFGSNTYTPPEKGGPVHHCQPFIRSVSIYPSPPSMPEKNTPRSRDVLVGDEDDDGQGQGSDSEAEKNATNPGYFGGSCWTLRGGRQSPGFMTARPTRGRQRAGVSWQSLQYLRRLRCRSVVGFSTEASDSSQ